MDRVPDYPDDVTVYLVVNDFGKLGKAYVETDITEADRETTIRNFISGQYSNALRVVAFNTAEGWSRDVSEDIANNGPAPPALSIPAKGGTHRGVLRASERQLRRGRKQGKKIPVTGAAAAYARIVRLIVDGGTVAAMAP
jgi:hypothetical protein